MLTTNEIEDLSLTIRDAIDGNSDAQVDLGIYFLYGELGLKEDAEEAFKWFKRASEAGNMHAMADLWYCYKFGDGTQRDINKANECKAVVMQSGDTDAIGMITEEDTPFIIKKDSDGTQCLRYYDGCNPEVVIPEGVTFIGNNAFVEHDEIEKIVIPGSVEGFDVYALSGLKNLKQVEIKEGVTSLHRYVFADNPKLESVILPESLKSIIGGAFENCPNLKKVELNKDIKLLSDDCFDDVEGILKQNPECFPEVLNVMEIAKREGLID